VYVLLMTSTRLQRLDHSSRRKLLGGFDVVRRVERLKPLSEIHTIARVDADVVGSADVL